MTKKQLKQLAKQIAAYEKVIAENQDSTLVSEAKDRISQLTISADLDLADLIKLDELIQNFLSD